MVYEAYDSEPRRMERDLEGAVGEHGWRREWHGFRSRTRLGSM